MGRAAQHHRNRSAEMRVRIAQEAARLIAEHGIRDYHQAKRKAAERLGIDDDSALPRNSEIEAAVREFQRLFAADQPALLRERREAALRAMDFLARFDPRLVGPVLEGTADEHSAVCLQLFNDDPEAIGLFLREQGIPFEQSSRRLRLDRERSAEFAVYLFSADGMPFDITALPRDLLRQPPLDRIDERPQERASRSALAKLIDEEDRWA